MARASTTQPGPIGTFDLSTLPRQPAPPEAPTRSAAEDAVALRDRLTRVALQAAPERPDADDVVRFDRRWWDGAAYVPSMVVRSPRGRYRIVETAGVVTTLPAMPWLARRALRRIRRPATCDPHLLVLARTRPATTRPEPGRITVVTLPDGLPIGRPTLPPRRLGLAPLARIEQRADSVRCTGGQCSALVPVPPPGRLMPVSGTRCPACGHPA